MIKRYEVDYKYEEEIEHPDGTFVYYSAIVPILKAARVLADLYCDNGCDCEECQAARLIIEKTEGME